MLRNDCLQSGRIERELMLLLGEDKVLNAAIDVGEMLEVVGSADFALGMREQAVAVR